MEIDKQIAYMGKALEAGDFDALEMAILLNRAEKAIKEEKERLRDAVLNRLGGTKAVMGSVQIIPVDGRPKYKYDHIQAWQDAKARLKQIEQLAKQATQEGVAAYDPESGEEIEAAEISYSSNSYQIKKA